MDEYIFEVEAESLEEAKAQVKDRIPNGLTLISEKILHDGKSNTVKAIAETVENAYLKAESEIPNDAHIIKKKELTAPKVEEITFESEDDHKARIYAEKQLDGSALLKNLKLTFQGKKGFLGIGKKLNQYCAEILQQAIVEVTYKTKAKISVQAGKRLTNWVDFLNVMKENKEPSSAASFFSQYPHQIIFALISGQIEKPSYFHDIPFIPITKDIIDKAQHYIEAPSIPMHLSMYCLEFLPDRYKILSEEDIGRRSQPNIDALIIQVASCLKGRGNLNIDNDEKMAKYAYDAIRHYQNIPIVFYFFTLPYIDSIISTMEISKHKALISAYKGIEGLILGMYNDLGEGEVITDERIVSTVRSIFE